MVDTDKDFIVPDISRASCEAVLAGSGEGVPVADGRAAHGPVVEGRGGAHHGNSSTGSAGERHHSAMGHHTSGRRGSLAAAFAHLTAIQSEFIFCLLLLLI